MASGKTVVTGFLPSDDCLRTLSAFSRLGVQIRQQQDETVLELESPGLSGLQEPDSILDFGNSGTASRLMCGVLAGTSFFTVMTGDDSLRKRPMKRVVDPLGMMGAKIDGPGSGSRLPLAIRGTALKGISFFNAHKSAQVKSSVLLAGLNASGSTTVEEPLQTRDHTERLLPLFGGKVLREGLRTTVYPSRLTGTALHVPGD
jgi:3-phosphoshikimate 1-carboxyvinyltransferase